MVSEQISNPSSLRSGDHSFQMNSFSQSFSSIFLTSSNYFLWSAHIKRFLNSRNLLSHIIKNPLDESNPIFEEWKMRDDQVFILLTSSMDQIHRTMVICSPNSKTLWNQMYNLYRQELNLGRVFEVKRRIANMNEFKILRPITTDFKILQKKKRG